MSHSHPDTRPRAAQPAACAVYHVRPAQSGRPACPQEPHSGAGTRRACPLTSSIQRRYVYDRDEAIAWLTEHGHLVDAYRAAIKRLVDAAPPLTGRRRLSEDHSWSRRC